MKKNTFVQSLCDVYIEHLKTIIHDIIRKIQNCVDLNNLVNLKSDILQQIEEIEKFIDSIKKTFLSEMALQKLKHITMYDINILDKIISYHFPSESKMNDIVNKLQKFL